MLVLDNMAITVEIRLRRRDLPPRACVWPDEAAAAAAAAVTVMPDYPRPGYRSIFYSVSLVGSTVRLDVVGMAGYWVNLLPPVARGEHLYTVLLLLCRLCYCQGGVPLCDVGAVVTTLLLSLLLLSLRCCRCRGAVSRCAMILVLS